MASKDFLAFGTDGSIMSLDGKLVRKHGTIVDAAMLAAIRTTLGVPASAEGLTPSQNLADVADVPISRTNLGVSSKDEVNDRTNARLVSNAVYLNGTSNLITPTLGGAELNDKLTVHVAVKFGSAVAATATIAKLVDALTTAGAGGVAAFFQTSGDAVNIGTFDGTAYSTVSNAIAAIDYDWVYILSITIDYAGVGVTAYVDGAKVGSSVAIANSPNHVSTPKLQIGSSTADSHTGQTIYGVWVYNRAQTAAEIAEFAAHPEVLPPDQWGGADGGVYTSDFSAGADGWINTNSTVAGNIDSIGGQDDNLRVTVNAGTGEKGSVKSPGFTGVNKYQRISFEIYIPTANTLLDGFKVKHHIDGTVYTDATPATNTWVSVSFVHLSTTNHNLKIISTGGGVETFDSAGDLFYIRNVKITDAGTMVALLPEGFNSSTGAMKDASSNNFDTTPTSVSVVRPQPPQQAHAPSDSASDIIEEITAGVTKEVLRRMYGDGHTRGGKYCHVAANSYGYFEMLTASIANDAEWVLDDNTQGGQVRGFLTITQGSGSSLDQAYIATNGTAAGGEIVSDVNNRWTIADDDTQKNTASKLNFYRDNANSNKRTIRNKTGATVRLTIWVFAHYIA